jgi:hypothetical protein
MTKAVLRQMLKQRNGSIINMASVVGVNGNASQANYSASKAGMIGFTKSVAKELGGRNIRCNAIAPGFIETKMTEKLPEDIRNAWIQTIPLRRPGKPEDVANVATFLASDLSSYVSGQVTGDSADVKFFFTIGSDAAVKYGSNVFLLELSGGFDIEGIEIEGFGRSMLSELTYKDDSMEKNIDLTYGGLIVNYSPWHKKIVSPFVGAGIGIGNISLSDVETYYGVKYVNRFASDDLTLVMLQGGACVMINRWLFVNFVVRYEEAYGIQLYELSNKDFSGIAGTFAVKFKF